MRTKPRTSYSEPGYPDRREFLKVLRGTATGVGLGLVALPLIGRTSRGDDEESIDEVKARVRALAKQLGDKKFVVRKSATKQLIEIGKGGGANKPRDRTVRKIVTSAMTETMASSRDPEVVQRAKAVILAVTPKQAPQPPQSPVELEGDIAIEVIDH